MANLSSAAILLLTISGFYILAASVFFYHAVKFFSTWKRNQIRLETPADNRHSRQHIAIVAAMVLAAIYKVTATFLAIYQLLNVATDYSHGQAFIPMACKIGDIFTMIVAVWILEHLTAEEGGEMDFKSINQ